MTVPDSVPECNPANEQIPYTIPPRDFTPTERQRARAQQQTMNKLRRQIELAARKGVEALAVAHPEALHLDVGELARLAATRIAVDLTAGNVPGTQVHYAAQAVRTLVEVSRLEAGQATDITARVTANAGEMRELLQAVRLQAQAVLPPALGDEDPAPIEDAEQSLSTGESA